MFTDKLTKSPKFWFAVALIGLLQQCALYCSKPEVEEARLPVATQPKARKKLAAVAAIPTPAPTPTPSPTPTPTEKPILRVDVETEKPEITEELVDAGGNRGYDLKRTSLRRFRTPEGKTKTVYVITDKKVSQGFIETKTSTTTNINGILSKRAETKTETLDGTTTEIKDTNEWGMTTTEKIESNEVSSELKNTLTLNVRAFKADPQLQPDPEPEPTVTTENYSTVDSGSYGGFGSYEHKRSRRRRR